MTCAPFGDGACNIVHVANSVRARPGQPMLLTAEHAVLPDQRLAERQVHTTMAAIDHRLGARRALLAVDALLGAGRRRGPAAADEQPDPDHNDDDDDQILHRLGLRGLAPDYSTVRPSTNCMTKRDPA